MSLQNTTENTATHTEKNPDKMLPAEKRAASSLAFLIGLRMLGLFMVMPIISIFSQSLEGSTPLLIGLAVGIYGLTQALLQIPFGWISDQIGRKPVIIFGLALFIIGSLVAANSDHIMLLILGRALQGAGAIASTVMALVSDITREESRSKAMAMIGASIGVSFALALVIGPVLGHHLGLSGIFYVIAGLGGIGILLCFTLIPTPLSIKRHRDARTVLADFKEILSNKSLLRIDIGIFALHAVMTAFFVVVPLILTRTQNFDVSMHWRIYLPILLVSFVAMMPLVIAAEKYRKIQIILLSMISVLGISQFILLQFYTSFSLVIFAIFIYFVAFNTLEALLPSLVSKIAPAGKRGTSMGVYSTSQFLGAFFGGWMAGYLYQYHGSEAVFLGSIILLSIWWLATLGMGTPAFLKSFAVPLPHLTTHNAQSLHQDLQALPGVADVTIITSEKIAYLKIDPNLFDPEFLVNLKYTAPN